MTGSSVAGIITAIASGITAIALLAAALPALIKVLHQVREVHTLVNQQSTDSKLQVARLEQALRSAGIDVPADPSLGT